MNNESISNKILQWYDNNKRDLPWRKPKSKQQSQYFTLVSEIMLQQTQVKTVIPFFVKFVDQIPNFEILSKVKNKKLLKLWEGLGYYTRARNLKKTAQIIVNKYKNKLPKRIDELKSLPGIGDYTSKAILALEFDEKIIPIDANIERLLKRVLYLKKQNEFSKEKLISKIKYFKYSYRQRDYVQALMELGALVCKPKEPLCNFCPIQKNCFSFKYNDFEINKKLKTNKIKFFEADIHINNNKLMLIKNKQFNFLKDFLIFPMNEINKQKFNTSLKKKTKIKISNIHMNIIINKNNRIPKKRGLILSIKKLDKVVLPSFTKKIYNLAVRQ